MKTEKSILLAFLLNLFFAVFELIGGVLTGSVAILSDAVHDVGDAASIGVSFFLERKSQKEPDRHYTFGYTRFSVMGSVITTVILLVGSLFVITHAVERLFHPTPIDYNGMMLFALVGVFVNFLAAFLTRSGDSLNERAVNLHMLEDVLGWAVVLVGAVVMRFTDLAVIDPILSIGVAVFIFTGAIQNLKAVLDIFLEKTPDGVDIPHLAHHLSEIEGVLDVHHIHVWSMDGVRHYATMHVVAKGNPADVKERVRAELAEHGICHATLELEAEGEDCHGKDCHVPHAAGEAHAHAHHHHHHHHH